MGSYGASLHDGSEYTGCFVHKISREAIRDWHRPRIQALLEAGVDLLALETIPVLEEAEVLLDLIKEFPQAKAWLSFQCKVSGDIEGMTKMEDMNLPLRLIVEGGLTLVRMAKI